MDSFVVVRLDKHGALESDFGDDGVLILDETPTVGGACASAIALDQSADEFILAGHTTTRDGDQQFALARIKRMVPLDTTAPTAVTLTNDVVSAELPLPLPLLLIGLLLLI